MACNLQAFFINMKRLITLILLTIIFTLISPNSANADQRVRGASAKIALITTLPKEDVRVNILKSYLERNNSPLAEHAETFVSNADKYDLDWRLVAAIAGTESGFGLHIPYGSYNAWGWGVYGTNVHYFTSWEDGIETVSQNLRERYMDKWGATNVSEIGSFYAASPRWAGNVTLYMNRIENYGFANPENTLSLSL